MASQPSDGHNPKRMDLLTRGASNISTPMGTALFAFLRLADIPLQSYLLTRSFIPPASLFTSAPDNPVAASRAALIAMSAVAMLKQNIWLLTLSSDPMPPGAAIAINIFNSLNSAIGSILFDYFPPPDGPTTTIRFGIGVMLFLVGVSVELVSETQRRRFKSDPKNKGKLYTKGLFGSMRHPNYAGYAIWRAGCALVGGGPIWAAVVGGFFVSDFANRAIPNLDDYCLERYGEQYDKYKKEVKWRLFPGVY